MMPNLIIVDHLKLQFLVRQRQKFSKEKVLQAKIKIQVLQAIMNQKIKI